MLGQQRLRRPDKQEFTTIDLPISSVHGVAVTHTLDDLPCRLHRAAEERVLDVLGTLGAHGQRPVHAEDVVQLRARVRVDGESTLCST